MTIAQILNIKEFPYEIYENGKLVYHETSNGFWYKCKYDSNGKEIYFENSDGLINDKRPKPVIELTLDQIAEKMGIDVSQIRIKD